MNSGTTGREKSPECTSYEGEVEERLPLQPLPGSDIGCNNTTNIVSSRGWERVMQPPPKVRMIKEFLAIYE